MKKHAYTVLAVAALLGTILGSVGAQSDKSIAAAVPFNFVIRDRALPAGEYVFALVQLGGSNAVKIQSVDGHVTVFVPTRSAKTGASRPEPKLIFNRYADQYFLSQVVGFEDSTPQQVVRSRAEDRLAKGKTGRTSETIAARKR